MAKAHRQRGLQHGFCRRVGSRTRSCESEEGCRPPWLSCDDCCRKERRELPKGDPSRKYKGRTVFLGDQVRDQDSQTAIFEELQSAPAAMEAGRICDFYGSVRGNKLTTADGVQAYVQAKLRGHKTWVEIPRIHWPSTWFRADGSPRFYRPVVLLEKALYGHPNAGAFWESECAERVQRLGFEPIAEWPSVFWHPKWQLMLIVYVDDFKLAGPSECHDAAWDAIRTEIEITPPEGVGHFLGCNQRCGTTTLPGGVVANTMVYDMDEFLSSCVTQYLKLSGRPDRALRHVATPYLPDESGNGPARMPVAEGASIVCECCQHSFPHPTTRDRDASSVAFVSDVSDCGSDCESVVTSEGRGVVSDGLAQARTVVSSDGRARLCCSWCWCHGRCL